MKTCRGVLHVRIMTAIAMLLTLALSPSQGHAQYAIVVSEASWTSPEWQAVAFSLQAKRSANIVTYAGTPFPSSLRQELAALHPRYVCFVAQPQEAGSNYVKACHLMLRQLDADPYTDAVWGIVTGFSPAHAQALVNRSDPLLVRNALMKSAGSWLDYFSSGTYHSESETNVMWTRTGGQAIVKGNTGPSDDTVSLVNALNAGDVDIMVTSGHAAEHAWQLHYPVAAPEGFFFGVDGEIVAEDGLEQYHLVGSPNPKVYYAPGNCLIGHIPEDTDDRRYSMTLAWLGSGGAAQMGAYSVSTWFGYMGWGVADYFIKLQDRFTFAESCYLNNQALLFDQRHATPGVDPAGLAYDRDVFVLYGDPAYQARLQAVISPDYSQTLQCVTNGNSLNYTLAIQMNRAVNVSRPVVARLPVRILNPQVTQSNGRMVDVVDDLVLAQIWTQNDPNLAVEQNWTIHFTGLNAEPDLQLVTQPTGQTASLGRTAVLCVKTVGPGPLTYRWFKDGVALTNDLHFSGVTSACLRIADVQTDHQGSYAVVVSNPIVSVTSSPPAFLSVDDPAAFEIRIVRTEEHGLLLEVNALPDCYYHIESAKAITGPWTAVAVLLNTNLTQPWTSPVLQDPTNQSTFFRAVRIPQNHPGDADRDGMDDIYELNRAFLDPLDASDAQRDQDGDGIYNVGEFLLGTDPADPDTDKDFVVDGYEVQKGTSPTNASSAPPLEFRINSNALYTSNTTVNLDFGPHFAQQVVLSESPDMAGAQVRPFSRAMPYTFGNTDNAWRLIYLQYRRNDGTNSSPIISCGIHLDTVRPVLTIDTPALGSTTNIAVVRIEGGVSDSTPVQVTINGLRADGILSGRYMRADHALISGTNPIVIVATDAAGNSTSLTSQCILDTSGDVTPPSLVLDLPRDYEVTGGVTNWYDQTTLGDDEVLDLHAMTDERGITAIFTVTDFVATNGPYHAGVLGTNLWARVALFPGTNLLSWVVTDAAGNLTRSSRTIIRDSGFFFRVTSPAGTEVQDASSATVSGIASPMFRTASVTVNGVGATVTDHGTNVTFITTSPVPLTVGLTPLIAVADLNGRSYHADPPVPAYQIVHWHHDYVHNYQGIDAPDQDGYTHYNYQWLREDRWDAGGSWPNTLVERRIHHLTKTDYWYPNGSVTNGDHADEPTTRIHDASISSCWFGFDDVRDQYVSHGVKCWDHDYVANRDTLTFLKVDFDSQQSTTKTVIMQFDNLVYQGNPNSSLTIDPSAITFWGQRGFWYNGHISFIVPIETFKEYTITERDFTWPAFQFSGPRTDMQSFYTASDVASTRHMLGFSGFHNAVIKVDLSSIEFTSDHNLMHDGNDVLDEGVRCPDVEWVSGATGANAPMSHTAGDDKRISITLNLSVDGLPVETSYTITGTSAESSLSFSASGSIANGNVNIPIISTKSIGKEIRRIDASVSWTINVFGQTLDLGLSGPHRIYTTLGTPIFSEPSKASVPNEPRMQIAVMQVAAAIAAAGTAPDAYTCYPRIVHTVVNGPGLYSLDNGSLDDVSAWELPVRKPKDCIAIARFARNVCMAEGIPGGFEAPTYMAYYATASDPPSAPRPTKAVVGSLRKPSYIHPYDKPPPPLLAGLDPSFILGLADRNCTKYGSPSTDRGTVGCGPDGLNAFEAAVVYTDLQSKRWYFPAGVTGNPCYDTADAVVQVFQTMVWVGLGDHDGDPDSPPVPIVQAVDYIYTQQTDATLCP